MQDSAHQKIAYSAPNIVTDGKPKDWNWGDKCKCGKFLVGESGQCFRCHSKYHGIKESQSWLDN